MRYAMPPHDMYSPYGPPDPRTMGQPHMSYQSQPAPRQRTAIACRYCRRRKVRQEAGFQRLGVMLMWYRFVAPASKHQTTVDVPIANASSKNASSHRSPPKPKPLYRPTLRTHIFAILGLCHPNAVEDRYILNKGSLLFTGLTDNRWGQCHTTRTIRPPTATLCRLLGHIKAARSTMIEVTHSLPMFKIK